MQKTKSSLAALTLGAIGVVYGDIGTSVLYSVKEVFGSGHVPFTQENIYGVLSLLFWTLTVIVSLKYVVLVLRADNNGEGGLVAMLALASQTVKDKPRLRSVLLLIGIFGTSLFYGDGVITPAISVLSAVEGLEVVSPHFTKAVIPLTLVILFLLFWFQKHGTAGIGRFFGPITLVWFATIAALGIHQIAGHPEILAAISPHFAVRFIWDNPGTSFIILGAVVLCVTGAEALYADLGHFGKKPIRLAWFSVAMPALTLNYFGQGALLLANPAAVKNPFYMMAPAWALLPLVLMATMATVIASQALITGAFSVTRQVIQLGYLPRLEVRHTSVREAGQIYMPLVNWSLFVAIALAVVLFRSSGNLAAAYGIAVTLDMLITTTLTFFVIRYRWNYPLALCIAATGFFFLVDLAFFSSNLLKLFDGGWFPLLIGGTVFSLMMTWRKGRELLHQKLQADAIDLKSFLESVWRHPRRGCRARPSSCPASLAPCPTPCCTTSSTTRCCTARTSSSRCATTKFPGWAWTSVPRSRPWAATAGRSSSTTASRTNPTCRRRCLCCAPGAASSTPWRPATSCRAMSSSRASATAWRPGAKSCSPRCTATPAVSPTSCTCPATPWWSWAPRSSCRRRPRIARSATVVTESRDALSP